MEQIKKGSKVPRVTVNCEKCGRPFERSLVHPYITMCPECRKDQGKARKAERRANERVRCPECRALIGTDQYGMHRCHKCGEQWWALPGGFWREWNTDETFSYGLYVGSLKEETFRTLYDRHLQMAASRA